MKYILLLILIIPVILSAQFNPIDANTIYYWKQGIGFTQSNDTLDTWADHVNAVLCTYKAIGERPTVDSDSVYTVWDGIDDALISDSVVFVSHGLDTAGTIEAWFKNDDDTGVEYVIFLKSGPSGNNFWIRKNSNIYQAGAGIGGEADNIGWPATTYGYGWWFIGMTWSTGKDSILYYRKGIYGGFDVANTDFTGGDSMVAAIGAIDDGTLMMAGKIGEIRISNKRRTLAEHQDYYNYLQNPSWTSYVDYTNGNDNNSGLESENPIKTIEKVNARYTRPGDKILFKKNEVWDDTLNVPSSGIFAKNIYYSTYGFGLRPIIDQINLNNKDFISVSNCIKTINGIINPGNNYKKFGPCFKGWHQINKWHPWTISGNRN